MGQRTGEKPRLESELFVMKTVILTLVIFIVMIMIHECGHFFAARLCKVKVNEFSLGMGPKIFQKQGRETKYSLRLFPIGGYVSMEGEDESSEDARAFCNQKAWKRLIIVVAGATMNLLLGLAILIGVNAPEETLATNTILKFKDDAVSNSAGLQAGDEILKINGHRIFTDTDIVNNLLSSTSATMVFDVQRGGEKVRLPEVAFTTKAGEHGTKDQLYIDFYVTSVENSIGETISYSFRSGISLAGMIWRSLVDLFTGKVGFDQLSGPIGVGKVVGEVASVGLSPLMLLCAFLSINLGIFNLLPLPALDGGRLVFILIEMIFRRPVPAKWEAWVHGVGIIILLGLMAFIALKDIYQLF